MPLMGSLYVGASGLVTSQNSLNTTAHNLSNIDTTGYTRQQVYQANRDYNTIGSSYNSASQVGLGVSYSEVRAIRDYFLDQSYRMENGRSEYYSTSYTAISEMESLFGETEGTAFQDSLEDLKTTVAELKKDPSNTTNKYGDQIWDLNQQIKAIETGGVEKANDLRDQRDELLDKLSGMAKISY